MTANSQAQRTPPEAPENGSKWGVWALWVRPEICQKQRKSSSLSVDWLPIFWDDVIDWAVWYRGAATLSLTATAPRAATRARTPHAVYRVGGRHKRARTTAQSQQRRG